MFSAVLPCQGGRQSTLCITLPSDVDVGQSLLHHWQAKISLLGLALEMQHYLQGTISKSIKSEFATLKVTISVKHEVACSLSGVVICELVCSHTMTSLFALLFSINSHLSFSLTFPSPPFSLFLLSLPFFLPSLLFLFFSRSRQQLAASFSMCYHWIHI